MASFLFNKSVKEVLDRTLDLSSGLKLLLVTSSYVANQDDDLVDAGGANDVVDHELNVTNYTRGYGGAGRKATTASFEEQDTNNRAVVTDERHVDGFGRGRQPDHRRRRPD